ncbi:anti-sigma factor family protein [Kineococcus sp. SYSU DK006]|uniref:anti-sigma factor family protein n=1 Tax=Kineococcus sp. SYSU DK006 TaxID=3383127 RepID=UPI003D7EA47D
MSGPHLGTRVSPLLDGRLAADAVARAHEHLRACPDCAGAVESERLVKARLQALAEPQPSQDLLVRLLDIGGPSGPLPPRDAPMAVPARPVVGTAPPSRTDPVRARPRGTARRPAGRRARRRPVAAALAGTFSLLGAGIVGVLVLGTPGGDAPAPVAELRTRPSATSTGTSGSTSTGTPPSTPVSRPVAPSPVAPSPGASAPAAGAPTSVPTGAAPAAPAAR